MYQNCIFDLYGTLVDIRTDENKPEIWEKLSLFYRFYGAEYTPEDLKEAYETTVCKMTEGSCRIRNDSHEAYPEIRIEEVFQRLFEKKGISAGKELALHAGQFFRILSIDHLRLYEGTKDMLSAVKESGRRIYLLSNAQKIFTAYEMNALGITEYFDDIFISSECGCRKPDETFFRLLLEEHGIDPDSSIMIGNDGVCDIEGAKNVGLSTLYVRSNISLKEELPEADYVLKEMDMEKIRKILMEEKNL